MSEKEKNELHVCWNKQATPVQKLDLEEKTG